MIRRIPPSSEPCAGLAIGWTDMKYLRNPEVLRGILLMGILSAATVIAAWCMDTTFGVFTLILCSLFLFLHILITYRRYRNISALSAEIDRILHGENYTLSDDCTEGELAILKSEIYKMTVRLREQQQRMQEDKIYLADSLADISHQLRTPLTALHLLVARLSEPDLSPEKRLKLMHDMKMLLSRIDWLITALLKISKLDAGTVQFHAETIPLSHLLRNASEPLLIPLELRGIQLHIHADGMFSGDIAWTSEAIGNILKNCMEHTQMEGHITVRALENPLYTEICISDTGSGIAKEDLPHIFERFYKGKDSDDSSYGIGLALARMIISAQNGTIKAENAPVGGALFTIRFYKGTV